MEKRKQLRAGHETDLTQALILAAAQRKRILVFAILCAAIYVVFQVITSPKPVETAIPEPPVESLTQEAVPQLTTKQKALQIESEIEYQDALEKYEQQKETNAYLRELYEREITVLEEQLAAQDAYIERSLLMKLDPDNVARVEAQIFVPAATVYPYLYALRATDFLDRVAADMETDSGSLMELITLEALSGGVNIRVYAAEATDAEAIVNTFLKQARSLQSEFAQIYGEHRLDISGPNTVIGPDRTILTIQNDVLNNRRNIEWNITAPQNGLAALVEPVVPAINVPQAAPAAASKSDDAVEQPQPRTTADYIRAAIIGFLLGFFLGFFGTVAFYVLSNRILSSTEMNRRYALRSIAVFPRESAKGRFMSFIKQFGSDAAYDRMSADEQRTLALSNLSYYAGDAGQLVLTGTVPPAALTELIDRLSEGLPGRQLLSAPDFLRSASSAETVMKGDRIILVERANASRYPEVDRAVQQLYDWDKTILGSIVI